MSVKAIRLINFMGFADTGWLELPPVTLLFGANSTGKSAILRALLLLQQSLAAGPQDGPFLFYRDGGIDFGSYAALVRNQLVSNEISVWFRCRVDGAGSEAEGAIGAHELGSAFGLNIKVLEARLTYGVAPSGRTVVLNSFDLYDDLGTLLLSATAPRTDDERWRFGSDKFDPYAVDIVLEAQMETAAPDELQPLLNVWPFVYVTLHQGFFPVLEVSEAAGRESAGLLAESKRLLKALEDVVSSWLNSIIYLGPLRAEPQRRYDIRGQHGASVGIHGEHVVRALVEAQSDPLRKAQLEDVVAWLRDTLHVQPVPKPIDRDKTEWELRFGDSTHPGRRGFSANLREVGFGISQVLPLAVQVLLAPPGSTVIVEQPELHLHPKAQAALGDLFIRAAMRYGVHVLVETHSEHLLLRLRRRIAETAAGTVQQDLSLPDCEFATYFVTRYGGHSYIERIVLTPAGEFDRPPAAFVDFFAGDIDEIVALSRAAQAQIEQPAIGDQNVANAEPSDH